MAYKGIDISTWQQNVDYNKLKAQGIEFAIIRCGYGKYLSQKDTMFERHYEGLKNAGIKIGVYLYSYVTSIDNALLEAQNCLKIIEGKNFELPIFYDLEDKITKYLGKETITECAKVFCREIEKSGRKAGVYANLDWFTNYINVNELINNRYKIWLAQWNNQITANFKVDYWQYTSRGHIDGIPDVVDLNYCYDDISKTVDTVEKPVEKSRFEIGKIYTLQVDLNVRTGARNFFF